MQLIPPRSIQEKRPKTAVPFLPHSLTWLMREQLQWRHRKRSPLLCWQLLGQTAWQLLSLQLSLENEKDKIPQQCINLYQYMTHETKQ